MAESNPSLRAVDVAGEAPPGDVFPIEISVTQDGPDPWASDGQCYTKKLAIDGWKTPIEVLIDGEVVLSRGLCIAPGNDRTIEASIQSPTEPGDHSLTVRVYWVGGNAYDLEPMKEGVNDDLTRTLTVREGAPDPSEPTAGDKLTQFLENIAGALGTTITVAVVGLALVLAIIILL